jgi:superfamily I DNA/RNA helicase
MAYPYRKSTYTKQAPKPTPTPQRIERTPSPYQQAIIDWLHTSNGNLTVVATAGSGKTSTLEMLAWELPSNANAVFLAFGRAIADELSKRLPFPASTFHSLAFKTIGAYYKQKTGRWAPREWMQANNLHTIIDDLFGRQYELRSVVIRLVGLVKNENETPSVSDDTLDELVYRHNLELPEGVRVSWTDVFADVRAVLDACIKNWTRAIDYDDMLWLVERFNLRLQTYSHVFVDEAQDTNPLQIALIKRITTPQTRVVFVGDHAQAIYGFRGASSDALEIVAREFHTQELPLTVSYRCPSSVVKLASEYGQIESAPNAKEGTVSYPQTYKLTQFIPGQLVLCRNTAPLVTVAYKLIAARVPAQIKGRDIGVSLVSLIKKLSRKNETLESLAIRVSEYSASESAKLLAARKETAAQSVTDKCESILALIDGMTQEDASGGIPSLIAIITSLFDDSDGRGKVLLSTIHKSKGLEANDVVILDWHLCPSKMARQEWQRVQERNLQFVAITRSKNTLTFVQTETLTD